MAGTKSRPIGIGLLQKRPQRFDLFSLQQPLLLGLMEHVAIQMHGRLP